MRDALWLLKFDFKTAWRWHLTTFPLLIAIVYIFLKFSLGSVEAYFEQPTFGADIFYLIGYGGIVSVFTFRENLNPKRLRFDDYHVPFIRLTREMNVSLESIAQFYMFKVFYSITIFNIVIGYLLHPNWMSVLSISNYSYFILFTLGIGYILGFLSIAIYPIRRYITFTIVTTIILVILIFGSSIIFFVLFKNGLLGFIFKWIDQIGFVVPVISFIGAGISYYFSKGLMVKLIERRDFE